MKIGLVTVNYNSSEYTKSMLESLISNAGYINKIIIVDNASTNNQVALLENIVNEISEKSSLNIDIYKSKENTGYFGGLNIGLSHLPINELDGVIVCNNDLEFNDKFFNKLSTKKIDKNVFAICPSVKTIDNVYQNPSMATKPSKLRMIFYDLYYSNFILGKVILNIWRGLGLGANSKFDKDENEKNIFIGIGAIYYLTKNYFEKNDLLPTDTFLYGEEAFLSKQIMLSGGVQLYYPDIEVLHHESISTKKMLDYDKYILNKNAYSKYKDYFKGG